MDKDILSFIKLMSKLPGLGPRSARRLVLYLLQNKENFMLPILRSISLLESSITHCLICGNLDKNSPCTLCNDSNRDNSLLCIVEEVIDLWALERGGIYNGLYHVLGGNLSAIDGIGPDKLNISSLQNRIEKYYVKEVILATGATVEGQTTANYIVELIKSFSDVKISSLANGIPMGGEMDYLDEGTLSIALDWRRDCN
ncbi:MAG: recombination protein RecR [Rickettsiaceae bacterium H1]|nr:recombination protein RecR [Rickettsiaceae bacterium H1]